ncbi:uncharacterized protein LOC131211993 [Anopheles bellator]|uniref:uncharacterized protein LOC131211993 n=1 Tax=Anopheles bellator TaxID=139047 RepID=UPI0026483DF7|nr:uncharacterized protein LOC131211993 [Anopheles bellator]
MDITPPSDPSSEEHPEERKSYQRIDFSDFISALKESHMLLEHTGEQYNSPECMKEWDKIGEKLPMLSKNEFKSQKKAFLLRKKRCSPRSTLKEFLEKSAFKRPTNLQERYLKRRQTEEDYCLTTAQQQHNATKRTQIVQQYGLKEEAHNLTYNVDAFSCDDGSSMANGAMPAHKNNVKMETITPMSASGDAGSYSRPAHDNIFKEEDIFRMPVIADLASNYSQRPPQLQQQQQQKMIDALQQQVQQQQKTIDALQRQVQQQKTIDALQQQVQQKQKKIGALLQQLQQQQKQQCNNNHSTCKSNKCNNCTCSSNKCNNCTCSSTKCNNNCTCSSNKCNNCTCNSNKYNNCTCSSNKCNNCSHNSYFNNRF